MVTYESSDDLMVWEAYDDFRRRDWLAYGAYWIVTGATAQEYVDKVAEVKQKVRDTIDDRLACILGFIDWLGDDSDPLE